MNLSDLRRIASLNIGEPFARQVLALIVAIERIEELNRDIVEQQCLAIALWNERADQWSKDRERLMGVVIAAHEMIKNNDGYNHRRNMLKRELKACSDLIPEVKK